MQDLSLHLLDLAQNSITAGAHVVQITVFQDQEGKFGFEIMDDGKGMDENTLFRAQSPFGTSRTTRKIGLGIPLTKEQAIRTGGSFEINSKPGSGTRLKAVFDTRHLDCQPLGNLMETLFTLIMANQERPDFVITLKNPQVTETLDTRDIKQALGEVPLSEPAAATWLMQALSEMTQIIIEGVEG